MNTIRIQGKDLSCQHCGHGQFEMKQVNVENAFGLNWIWLRTWSSLAHVYVCLRCGFVHWFFATPESAATVEAEEPRARAPEAAEPIACLSCGQTMTAGVEPCAACGWTWRANAEAAP